MNKVFCAPALLLALVLLFVEKSSATLSLWDEDSLGTEDSPQVRSSWNDDLYGGNSYYDEDNTRSADDDEGITSPADSVVQVLKRLYTSYRGCLRAQPCATRKGRRYVSGCKCPRGRSCQAAGRGMYQCM